MQITFLRGEGSAYVTQVRRDDGVVLEVPSYDRKAAIPHDIAHYIVERELGLTQGFWGCVAAGALFPGIRVLSGKQPPHPAERSRAILREAGQHGTEAEVLVGIFIDIVHENLDSNPAALQARLRDAWRPNRPAREPLETAEGLRVCAALRQIQQQWNALSAGQHLTVDWPGGKPNRRTHR